MVDGTASHTSTSLIRAAKANDAEAWTRLVQTYGRRVYLWCRQAGLQAADSSNVVQEVLRSVARSLPDFHHGRDGDTFRGWIRRITQNKLRDYFRQQGKQLYRVSGGTDAYRQMSLVAAGKDDGDSRLSSERTGRVENLLIEQIQMMFSHRDWQMFWQVAVEGQSAPEVAEEFDVSANAVRLVKMRVLRQLRKQLAPPTD